jgi:O-antigen/teichoic acid export membrane protein
MTITRRLRAILPRGRFGRGVLTLATGTGLAQVIVIATSPILTRLYSPSQFGTFAVAMSIVSVLITITCLRYEYAIPLPKDDVTAANVLALSLLILGVVSVLAGIVLWLVAPWAFGLFGAAALAPYVWIMSLAQVGGGLVSAFTNWAVRTKSFSDIAASRLAQSVGLVSVQAGLGALGAGPAGLLLGDAVGRLSGSSRLVRSAWRGHSSAFRLVSWAGVTSAAKRYRRFPIFSSGSALLTSLSVQAPVLLLVAAYGTSTGGQFVLAVRICAIPLSLIADAVGQVVVAEAAGMMHDDPAELRTLFRSTTSILARAAIVPAVLVMLLAPLLTGWVFGPAWDEAGLFVAVLVPSYYVAFVIGSTGDLLFVLERQDLHLAREVLRFVLMGGAVPLAAWLGLSALEAVALLSAAGVLYYSLYGLVTWRAIRSSTVRATPATAGNVARNDPGR